MLSHIHYMHHACCLFSHWVWIFLKSRSISFVHSFILSALSHSRCWAYKAKFYIRKMNFSPHRQKQQHNSIHRTYKTFWTFSKRYTTDLQYRIFDTIKTIHTNICRAHLFAETKIINIKCRQQKERWRGRERASECDWLHTYFYAKHNNCMFAYWNIWNATATATENKKQQAFITHTYQCIESFSFSFSLENQQQLQNIVCFHFFFFAFHFKLYICIDAVWMKREFRLNRCLPMQQ